MTETTKSTADRGDPSRPAAGGKRKATSVGAPAAFGLAVLEHRLAMASMMILGRTNDDQTGDYHE